MHQDWQDQLRQWSEQTARRMTTPRAGGGLMRSMARGMAGLGWLVLMLAVLWLAGPEEVRRDLTGKMSRITPTAEDEARIRPIIPLQDGATGGRQSPPRSSGN